LYTFKQFASDKTTWYHHLYILQAIEYN